MSLKISLGATQSFVLIVFGGVVAAAWTSRRMRLRHQAELRKAGLLPEQMESEFYRMKFKREGGEGSKVKETPPNSARPTPNSTPLRGAPHMQLCVACSICDGNRCRVLHLLRVTFAYM